MTNKVLLWLVGGVLLVLLLLLGLAGWALLGQRDAAESPPALTPSPTTVVAVVEPSPTAPPATLPGPAVVIVPTNTPTNTPIPTGTPIPTDTPIPTETPLPTRAPAPTVIRPTNTAVPPTNTPVPQPSNINGISASHFALQPNSVFAVNQPVWFEFVLSNSAGGPVPFGALGVMPRKAGADRLDWYQNSWGGNDDSIPSNGLSWNDNIRLPESGQYTLRLVICFDAYQACRNGSGTFHSLSPEIPVTIP